MIPFIPVYYADVACDMNKIMDIANRFIVVFHYLSLHLSEYYKEHSNEIPNLPSCDHFADCLMRLSMYYELKESV